ncbi:MAG TPA: efflux RND transporter periplasmic adaptor subunit [Ktedonobacteraceae bacterium]|jgi:multidrug resistance efflux pump|nr:efflux RND transporter periplasmic adaptor subunit [Ktedonobacteraceae bacterium]
MRRLILVPLLIFIALLAIGGVIVYAVWNNYTYYSTDDAQVTGPIVNVSAPAAGILTSLSIKQGDTVTSGEIIGTVTLASGTNSAGGAPATINITSPMNGTVLQVPAVQNQTVAPGLTIAEVTNLSAINVTAYVDENSISNVSAGQAVDITIDAYSGTTLSGHVQQIVQAAAGEFSLLPNEDPTSGNFTKVGQRIPVIITLDNTGGKDLLPGMSAEVTIHLH